MTDPQAYAEAAARVRNYDALGRHRSVRLGNSDQPDLQKAHAAIRARIEALRDSVLGQFADPDQNATAGNDANDRTEPPDLHVPGH